MYPETLSDSVITRSNIGSKSEMIREKPMGIMSYKGKGRTRKKAFLSRDYNYVFMYDDGFFARWGKTKDDDPSFSPIGPEILDIEVSTVCHGIPRDKEGEGTPVPCSWCYKSNTGCGENMDLETFKKILDNIKGNLMQVAFGIGDIDGNPDLFDMMIYCRNNRIVPNVTINGYGLTDEIADRLKTLCGAVAISRYEPKDICYGAVKKLTDRGMKQVNIHMLVSEETFEGCLEVLEDAKTDERLENLNAIVFLMLKHKGDRNTFHPLAMDKYRQLIKTGLESGINIGMDSCSGPKFLECIQGRSDKKLEMVTEPCESCCFSFYVNAEGKAYPCSFCEGMDEFEGVDVIDSEHFIEDVWYGKMSKDFRFRLIETAKDNICRSCPVFNI